MFKKWFVVFTLLLSSQAHAYQQGEMLSASAQKQLGLDPNRVSLVDFFAEWCVSCRAELPEVNQLAPSLSLLGVDVVGVDVDEDVAAGIAFQQSLGINFRVVNDAEQTLVDDFQPIGMPALYYIYQGQVLKVRYGAINHIGDVIMSDLKGMGLGQ
ncbi:TlpA disulfide reductase family protein [Moritella sp.]|uniref:TlpA family protein disulfide reductase n=1 Tax=Moritella sp. TaxID=78556 RepID=UPI001DEFE378|nr:TlpA disulfide reductase family protein [Moritella sp.]MCJ8350932.1 TlpA family protein disulfide reductase [Moritella sp.]NQZ40811.1 TlpA family protein disulfide reductase [Moritella sp.]